MSLHLPPTGQTDRSRCSPAVELLPAGQALDFEYVAARLHDPALLHGAVAVQVFRAPLLAVPVGGCRRGGRLAAGPFTVALAVHDALQDRAGFPLLRLAERAQGDWLVEWGELLPEYPGRSREARRFFGYATPGAGPSCPELAQDDDAAPVTGVPDHRRAADTGGCAAGRGRR
ncbi:MAG: hypothetical protein HOY69_37430 [Streptomyces sp.]|nr:hypothetical protein [Streptomyces sp.]